MKSSQIISNILIIWIFTEVSGTHIATFIHDSNHLSPQVESTGPNGVPDIPEKKRRLVKRWADRYRFFGAGLGKRADDDITQTANSDTIKTYLENYLDVMRTKSHLSKALRQLYKPKIKLLLNKILSDYSDSIVGIDQAENKRVPEVFEEEYYPLQAGKQQLEFKLDKTLDNDTADEPMDDYPRDISVQAADLTGLYSNGNTNIDSNDEDSAKSVVKKRWWAIKQLTSFRHPKSAASPQWRRRGRFQIDPALFFVGLGR